MRVNYLSKRETSELASKIRLEAWGKALGKEKLKRAIQVIQDEKKIYRIGRLVVGEIGGRFIPLIHERNLEALDILPAIVVDVGAVPHILNGADVMRPGVKEFMGSFVKGDLIVVREERNLRPIAVAISLNDSERCRLMKRGKIAENIHHINDKVWKLMRSIRHILEREL